VDLQLLMGLSSYDPAGKRISLGLLNAAVSVAAIIAVQHCDARDGGIVTALGEESMAGCEALRFPLKVWDTRSVPSITVKAFLDGFNRIEGATDFTIGPPRSSGALPTSLLATAGDIPMVSHWATSEELDGAIHENFYRTIPSDRAAAKAAAQLFETFGLAEVGMIHIDDSYGSTYRGSLLAETNALGVGLQAFAYREADELSLRAAINGFTETGLNVLFLVVFDGDLSSLLSYLQRRGFTGAGRLVIFSDAVSVDGIGLALSQNQDLLSIVNGSQAVTAVSGDENIAAWRRLHSAWPGFISFLDFVNAYLPGGANVSNIDEEDEFGQDDFVLQLSDDFFNLTQQFVIDVAYAYDAVAVACIATCNAYKRAAEKDMLDEVAVFNGRPRPAWITGSSIREIIKDETETFKFEGASGEVRFVEDSGSRDPASSLFKVRNVLVSDGSVGTVEGGRWVEGKWLFSEMLVFPPGNIRDPPRTVDVPVHDENVVTKTHQILSGILAAIGMALCVGLNLFIRKYARTRVMRKAQPEFLHLFLFGVMVTLSGLIPWSLTSDATFSIETASRSCNAFMWLVSLGITITSSAMVLKLYRIMKIFHNPSLKSLLLRSSSLLKMMFILVVVNLVLLVVPTAISPLHYERILLVTDKYGNALESFGRCQYNDEPVLIAFAVLLVVFHISLYAGGMFIAYSIRNVDRSFQEGNLTFAVMFQGQLYLFAAPIYIVIAETETNLRFFLVYMAIFLGNVVAVLFVMLPKIQDVRAEMHQDRLQRHAGSRPHVSSASTPKKGLPSKNRSSSEEGRKPKLPTPDELTEEDSCDDGDDADTPSPRVSSTKPLMMEIA